MTLVVDGASGLGADNAVVEYTYSSQHEEREVATYRPYGGVPHPPGRLDHLRLGQRDERRRLRRPAGPGPVPARRGGGAQRHSTVCGPGGGVVRVNDWQVSIIGRDTVTAAGQAVDAWVVAFERHGEGKSGLVTPAYDAHYTATLVAARLAR